MRIKNILFGLSTLALSAYALNLVTEDKKANVGGLETKVETSIPVLPSQNEVIVAGYDFRQPVAEIAEEIDISNWAERYSEFVHEAAEEYNLEPKLLFYLIQRESSGDPKAFSNRGAIGLMQVMPSTAMDYISSGNLFDPRTNIMTGAAILSDYLRRFNNNMEHALAAYNAGPTTVKNAMSDGVLHKDRLPRDTRDYLAGYNNMRKYNKD